MTAEAGSLRPGPVNRDALLASVGLSPLQSRAYRALVELRESTPEDLRRRLGLGADEAERAFAALTAKGLVTTTTGEPPRLVAAPDGERPVRRRVPRRPQHAVQPADQARRDLVRRRPALDHAGLVAGDQGRRRSTW